MTLKNVRGNIRWTRFQLEDLWKEIQPIRWAENIRMDVGAMVTGEGIPVRRAYALAIYGQGIWLLKALYCCFANHDIVDEGYGGPESGRMCLMCRRCGKTLVDHWLY